MSERRKNRNTFDALLKVAVAEAFESELDSLPPDEELEDYAPTPDFSKRIELIIRKSYKKWKTGRTLKTLGKIAACLCIVATVSSVALLSVDATRNAIFNAVIEWRDRYTQFQFKDSSSQTFKRPGYVPQGFNEKSSEFHEIMGQIVYENSAGVNIIVNEEKAGTGTTAVDNEHHDYSEIEINGNKAYLFTAREKGEANILLWESHGIVYSLLSPIDTKELVRIGESLG